MNSLQMPDGAGLRERGRWLEVLLALALSLHGTIVLRGNGRAGEWLWLGLVLVVAVWALWPRRTSWGAPARAAVLLLVATALAFTTGGPGSLFALWFFTLVALYPLLLSVRPALLLIIAAPLLYLLTGLGVEEAPLPVLVAFSQAVLLALVGGGALALRLAREEEQGARPGEAAAEQEALARQADKVESLSRLAAGFAHDFNNLFTAIIGQISLAMTRIDTTTPTYGYLQSARRATEKAVELTGTMQLYAGRTEFDLEELDVNALLPRVEEELQQLLPRPVHLEVQPAAELPLVMGNAEMLALLLREVVRNAVEAIGDAPGRITISTNLVELPEPDWRYGRYLGQPFGPGRYVALTVTDDGRGMDPETLDTLFEPFYSTHSKKRGLGLARVLGIMRRHEGGVCVRSTPGEGSRFSFLLPPAGVPVEAAGPLRRLQEAGSLQFVLLVTRDTAAREALQDALARPNFRVMSASEGSQALALFRSFAANVAVVILDWELPGMAAQELLAELRAIRAGIPVIVAGARRPESVAPLQPAGLLETPFSANELLASVEPYLAK